MDNYEPLDIDDVVKEVALNIGEAVNHIEDHYADAWEEAQIYYGGDSGIPKVEGRSKATKTVLRDSLRAIRPSLLRVFLQADTIVEYIPSSRSTAPIAYQQSKYVNNLFWEHDGYKILNNIIQDAALKKYAVVKFWFDKSAEAKYVKFTAVPEPILQMLMQRPDVTVISANPIAPMGAIPLYDCEVARTSEAGSIRLSSVPLQEFFIDDEATCPQDSRICGTRESITFAEGIALGFSEEDLEGLDDLEPQAYTATGETVERKGYMPLHKSYSVDPMMKRFLYTEAYAYYDLDNTGVPQLYKFCLGGSSYEYLYHERVSFHPYAMISIDPEPHAQAGNSLHDILKEDQDVQTSLLRATVDNAHLSNNKRLAVHDTMVNLTDVMNNTIGAPIRVRQPGMIQEIAVQSSIATMLPLLENLDRGSQIKVGVTDAAVGLDSDRLQSTTKEAVQNTLATSQGQIEVMARNIAEGLRVVMNGLLRLSMWHLPRQRITEIYGELVEVDQNIFNPTLMMRPKVGIGSGDVNKKIAGLTFIYAEQKEMFAKLGANNPVVRVKHMQNTLEDLANLHGIHNLSRYFEPLDEATEAKMLEGLAKAQADGSPLDPGKALVQSEQVKAEIKQKEIILNALIKERQRALEMEFESKKYIADMDFQRDKLAQELEIKEKDLQAQERIKREQNKVRPDPVATTTVPKMPGVQ